MFEGKIFLPFTGMPILKRARRRVRFEVWLPVPFAVAMTIEKSFTISATSWWFVSNIAST
jgi:hypothetical protein